MPRVATKNKSTSREQVSMPAAKQPTWQDKAPAQPMYMSQNSYSFEALLSNINNNFVVYFIAAVFFFAGFFVGSLWTEAKMKSSPSALAPAAAAPDAGPQGPTKETLANMPELTDDERVDGDIDSAKVVLVEYSDFECPFCARFHPTAKQLKEKYGEDLAIVYRHFPLPFHPNAQKAAEGSECVAEQLGNEAFWKYADSVFETTGVAGKLTPEDLEKAATAAGANITTFKSCLDSGKYAEKVNEQKNGGSAAGIDGTPGSVVVVDGVAEEAVIGALPFESVTATLDKYMQ